MRLTHYQRVKHHARTECTLQRIKYEHAKMATTFHATNGNLEKIIYFKLTATSQIINKPISQDHI
jgi:hypothetical protein